MADFVEKILLTRKSIEPASKKAVTVMFRIILLGKYIKPIYKKNLLAVNKIKTATRRIIETAIINNPKFMKQNQKKYDTSQEIFYQVCENGRNLCSRYLTNFVELKAYYTSDCISNAMQALTEARKRTSNGQTLNHRKELRINMVKDAAQVLYNWQLLKQYTITAYSGSGSCGKITIQKSFST